MRCISSARAVGLANLRLLKGTKGGADPLPALTASGWLGVGTVPCGLPEACSGRWRPETALSAARGTVEDTVRLRLAWRESSADWLGRCCCCCCCCCWVRMLRAWGAAKSPLNVIWRPPRTAVLPGLELGGLLCLGEEISWGAAGLDEEGSSWLAMGLVEVWDWEGIGEGPKDPSGSSSEELAELAASSDSVRSMQGFIAQRVS